MSYFEALDKWLAEHPPNKNPMVNKRGLDPYGRKCKSCEFLIKKEFSKNYYKCQLRGDTNGMKTDHRLSWDACKLFEVRKRK